MMPITDYIMNIMLVVLIVAFKLFVGSKESIIPPIRNTDDGIPTPVTTADVHPMYMRTLSAVDANV